MSHLNKVNTTIKVSLKDRIKLLFSGSLEICLTFKTDNPIDIGDENIVFDNEV